MENIYCRARYGFMGAHHFTQHSTVQKDIFVPQSMAVTAGGIVVILVSQCAQ
jgi:hypothetical protein